MKSRRTRSLAFRVFDLNSQRHGRELRRRRWTYRAQDPLERKKSSNATSSQDARASASESETDIILTQLQHLLQWAVSTTKASYETIAVVCSNVRAM